MASSTFRITAEGEQPSEIAPPEDVQESQSVVTLAAFKPNGCTLSPDRWGSVNFKPACDTHDYCYVNKKKIDRFTCDVAFLGNLIATCKKALPKGAKRTACFSVAGVYHTAVRVGGWGYYKGNGRNN